ncbi:sugar transferase [Candidatus Kaiserbacteria bacterium]|nr:sugar transferase [Candidatus Kaiserbacteria bacterium]
MAFDRRETAILLIGDFIILVASLWVALFLRNLAFPSLSYFETNIIPFLPMFVLSLVVFYIAGLYEKQTRPIRSVMGIRILGAQAATVAITAILFFVLPLSIEPKTILVLYLVVSVVAESAWRFYQMKRELGKEKRESALLIGSGAAISELYEEVRENPRYLINFVRHLETAGLGRGDIAAAISSALGHGTRVIVVDLSDPIVARDLSQLYNLAAEGAVFLEFAALYEEIFDRVPLEHFNAGELLESLPRRRAVYDVLKRLFDIVLALVLSLIALPFIGLAALLLSVNGGQPFIRNERIGSGGRIFHLIKLRSMLFYDHGDPELHKKNRVTALGRLLRKTRVDELPQLWNVLAGDISFIGPRPEIPKLAEVYEREIPLYRMRHLISPGLSGWAQIHDYDAPHGPADIPRTRRKLPFDLYYLKHRSFGLDLAIAAKTIRTLLTLSGA